MKSKILIVGGSKWARGGVERFCSRLSELLSNDYLVIEKPSNSAIYTSKKNDLFKNLICYFIAVLKSCFSWSYSYKSIFYNLGNGLDLVQIFFIALFNKNVYVIVHTSKGWKHYDSRLATVLFSFISRMCNVYAITEAQKKFLLDINISVDGVAPTLISNAALLTDLNLQRDERIVFAGRVVIEKGIDDFIQIVDLIRSQNSKFEFVIAGDINHLDVELINKINVSEIKILGYLDEDKLAKLFSTSSILVYPSYSDTYPLVVLESISCGLPVVAYDIEANIEISNLHQGIQLAKRGDIGDLALIAMNVLKSCDVTNISTSSREKLSRSNALSWYKGLLK